MCDSAYQYIHEGGIPGIWRRIMNKYTVIGASLSEPHASKSNSEFIASKSNGEFIYIFLACYYVVAM